MSGAGPAGPPGPLRIDREGSWWHEGVEVTHEGVLRGLWSSLGADGDRHFVQAGPVRVPVVVDDAPLVVRRIEPRADVPGGLVAHLSDGGVETLDAASLSLDGRGTPYCRVRAGCLRARLSLPAWLQLAAFLEEGPGPGELVLRAASGQVRIGRAARGV